MSATRLRSWDPGRNWPALGLIIGLHLGGLWALTQIQSVRATIQEVTPIMVGLISLSPPEPPKPIRESSRPKQAPIKPTPEPQMIATEIEQPAATVASVPEPVPVEESPPSPTPAQPAPQTPATPPNFVAAYLDNPSPRYPAASRRLGEEGKVLLRVLVNSQGRAEALEIEASSGYSRLDRAALDAVRNWKFIPAQQDDQAIAAWVLVPLNFELQTS